jgi:catechol 2,3-dioxygenase-like lactoylglutathione lyase family enzyme
MKESGEMGQIEHVNLTVSDPDRSSALFQKLLGWHERWRGAGQSGGWTIHVGSTDAYLALYTEDGAAGGYAKGVPLNHIGLQVSDLAAAERVVADAGLIPFGHGDYEPGRRFYFFDWDGIEFEVVSYQ